MAGKFVALDFETTGLNPQEHRIIEIGAVKFSEDGELIDTFEILVDPGQAISKEAQKIHKVTDQMVQGKAPPHLAWSQFLNWAGDVNTFVSHNAEFEARFINSLYPDTKHVPPIFFIDTLDVSRARLKHESSYALGALVPELAQRGHRALPDAAACAELFVRLSKTYKSGKIPIKSYIRPISSFKDYRSPDAPTLKQLDYIDALGGDRTRPTSKSQASEYIDYLKGNITSDSPSKPRPSIGLVLLVLSIVFGVAHLIAKIMD